MKLLRKLVCHLLIASMTLLPFAANAGMVSTGEAIMSAQERANRDTVRDFISRQDVANELKALGVSAAAAQERAAAMTQEEVNTLAGRIDEMPAGGSMAFAVVAAILILFAAIVTYYIMQSKNAEKEKAAK